MSTDTSDSTLRIRLIGLLAVLGLVAVVTGAPVLLLAIHAIPNLHDLAWSRLSARDDGTAAQSVITIVAWVFWAIFAVSVALDIAARIRGLRAPRLPGLLIPQHAAHQLVGAAAMLFVAIPSVTSAVASTVTTAATVPRAVAAIAPVPPAPARAAMQAAPVPAGAPVLAAEPHVADATEAYTVRRGDSLWKIAETRLGDGARYVELIDLNRHVLGDEPGFLMPGTTLRVPIGPSRAGEQTYTVRPGDTLSRVAEDELGNAADYPEIYRASRSTAQPDGEHLTDPDLIRPGWELTIPDTEHHQATPTQRPGALPNRATSAPAPPVPTTAPDQGTTAPQQTDVPAAHDAAHDVADDGPPGWVLPGLAGAGAGLAGAILLVLRQHRRTQLRFRRPGHVIAPPPQELRSVEKSTQASGSITAPRVTDFDQALRTLASEVDPPPRLLRATLESDAVILDLAEPAVLPEPWTGDGTRWRRALFAQTPIEPTCIAPYPLLVSVGSNGDGSLIYLNLEELHSAVITGDTEPAEALGRHIAAELAVNPWSSLVEIETLGIGAELAEIDPTRLHHHADGDIAFLDHLASDLEAEDPALDPDQYRALVTTAAASDAEAVHKVAKIITSYTGRAGAAVLTVQGEPRVDDAVLAVTPNGLLRVLGLDLTAARLSPAEARACATLLEITRESTLTAIPLSDESDAVADLAGALVPTLVEPRPADTAAGPTSLLPLSTGEYEDAAAAVEDDLAELAPLATSEAARAVREKDPDLDEDLARWHAPTLSGPKLTVLGPVSARTLGDPDRMAHRKPFYVELLAYLTLHPQGVTAEEVSEAFGIQTDRARKDLGILRRWLGSDQHTGEAHLPNVRQTHIEGVSGTYRVQGVATDMDLFRRLRARGQSRGAEGISDLCSALALVTGEPFSDLRARGWGWLLEGERLDHVMSCAIVDTGHLVTTHALAAGDLELARFSAATAYRAAPYDDIACLDLIAVDKACGEEKHADDLLADGIFDRSDDDLGPLEVPERSARIAHQHCWDKRRTAG